MRRALLSLACACAVAAPAVAQVMPPSVKKPIEAAKKAAAASNAQTQASQKTGEGKAAGAMPAATAQQGGAKGAQGGAKSAPQKAAPGVAKSRGDSARVAAADSASRRGSATQSGGKATVTFFREEFHYDSEGRRDPFLSLLATGELRPLLADLALIGVLHDNTAPNSSVAVLEDGSNKDTYRVKQGDVVGRMKVVRIGSQDITFSIDEFGFSRQEKLLLDMTRKAGGQPGRRPQ
jgi:hypothetical protein